MCKLQASHLRGTLSACTCVAGTLDVFASRTLPSRAAQARATIVCPSHSSFANPQAGSVSVIFGLPIVSVALGDRLSIPGNGVSLCLVNLLLSEGSLSARPCDSGHYGFERSERRTHRRSFRYGLWAAGVSPSGVGRPSSDR